jgi:hypothetical protein
MRKVVHPSFEIDDKGRTLCKYHTRYDFFKSPHKNTYQEAQVDKLLTCKTCEHYFHDDCYFPQRDIKLIRFDQSRSKFRCELCGNPIHRLINIVQSLYYESQFHTKLPLICCSCHASLNKNTFMNDSMSWTYRNYLRMVVAIIAMLAIVAFILIRIWSVFFVLIIIDSIYMIYLFSRKRAYLKKGRKLYQKFIEQTQVNN